MVDGWWETSLPTLLLKCELKAISNTNNFRFFYESLPNKSYQLKSEKCFDRKLRKIYITGLAVANIFWE